MKAKKKESNKLRAKEARYIKSLNRDAELVTIRDLSTLIVELRKNSWFTFLGRQLVCGENTKGMSIEESGEVAKKFNEPINKERNKQIRKLKRLMKRFLKTY